MMELHLIRHGQTNWNEERRVQGQSESELTDLGKQQADELGLRLMNDQFSKVYCSSSVRTRQTADHIFRQNNHQDMAEISYQDSLREIFLGPWEGSLYTELEQSEPDSHRHFWKEPHLFDVTGAESFFDLQTRAMTAIKKIAAARGEEKVAIVSHGALIKTILCHVENRPISELWAPPLLHNCAHSIIEVDTEGLGKIIQYADQAYSS